MFLKKNNKDKLHDGIMKIPSLMLTADHRLQAFSLVYGEMLLSCGQSTSAIEPVQHSPNYTSKRFVTFNFIISASNSFYNLLLDCNRAVMLFV